MPALFGVSYRRFQMPEVSPLLKTWLGVLGLETCGCSSPTPCFHEHMARVVCIFFSGNSAIQLALGVESHRLRCGVCGGWGGPFSQVLLAPGAQSCVQEVRNHLDRGWDLEPSPSLRNLQLHRCVHEWERFTQSGSRFAQRGGCGTEVPPPKDTTDLIYTLQKICAVGHSYECADL